MSETVTSRKLRNVRIDFALSSAVTQSVQSIDQLFWLYVFYFLPEPLCPCLVLPESFKEALGTMMDMSLLKDPVFLLIGISNVFGMAGLYVPFVYLVDAAKKNVSMLLRLTAFGARSYSIQIYICELGRPRNFLKLILIYITRMIHICIRTDIWAKQAYENPPQNSDHTAYSSNQLKRKMIKICFRVSTINRHRFSCQLSE